MFDWFKKASMRKSAADIARTTLELTQLLTPYQRQIEQILRSDDAHNEMVERVQAVIRSAIRKSDVKRVVDQLNFDLCGPIPIDIVQHDIVIPFVSRAMPDDLASGMIFNHVFGGLLNAAKESMGRDVRDAKRLWSEVRAQVFKPLAKQLGVPTSHLEQLLAEEARSDARLADLREEEASNEDVYGAEQQEIGTQKTGKPDQESGDVAEVVDPRHSLSETTVPPLPDTGPDDPHREWRESQYIRCWMDGCDAPANVVHTKPGEWAGFVCPEHQRQQLAAGTHEIADVATNVAMVRQLAKRLPGGAEGELAAALIKHCDRIEQEQADAMKLDPEQAVERITQCIMHSGVLVKKLVEVWNDLVATGTPPSE